ncbi:ATPase domain-containing protein [Marinobacter caseinilyticus]|uniref:ATPase domain-containing protein n=1 Tax=Marinobacter caseinilyticus TaxID=2692195 RepID=UPI00140BA2BA|nr:ATPase domain-containing protein [Marinobacter caseinilyticus]
MSKVSTGLPGLDTILKGGLLPEASYLIRGRPGMGKTTLGLHFLSAASEGEPALFIGFQESDTQVRRNANTIGLDVSGLHFLSLSPDEHFFSQAEKYDVFASSDVEHAPLSGAIVEAVERLKPKRVFIDSLTQFRFLSADVFQYRKEVLSLISFLTSRGVTVLFTSEHSPSTPDDDLQFLADGVIALRQEDLGQEICVEKFRGSGFFSGCHQMRNGRYGIEIFPRPIPPKEEISEGRFTAFSTGLPELDQLLGGGLEMGTITMISGPSGIGKSTLSSCIATETAHNLGHTAVYLFEEEISSYLHRAQKLDIEVGMALERGTLSVDQIEPLRYLADEFASIVYQDVLESGTKMVVFDSTAGFELTLSEGALKDRLHALSKSLSRMNISVLLINETSGRFGDNGLSEKGISYLSDNVINLWHGRGVDGDQAHLQVSKKRLSNCDKTPHIYRVGPHKVNIVPLDS